jgi:hypothetical protein
MTTNAITEKKHATLGPSGWDWWSNCPGGPVLAEGRERKSSIYAFWGTVAHEIADYCLTQKCDAESFVGQVFKGEGLEVEVDMEMADCVNDYLATVYNLIDVEAGDILMPEQQVPIGHLTGEKDAEGTSDCVGICNGGKKLVVIDLKGGKGVEVSAHGNGQGRMYALGALEKFGLLYDEIEEVEIVIVQPRLDNTTSETLTVAELREFADEVAQAAGRVEQARGISERDMLPQYLNPGEKQCKFCPAKAICPALRGEIEQSMANVSQAADPEEFADLTMPKKASSLIPPADYGNETLAEAFRAIPLIEEWVKAIESEMLLRLTGGQEVPGFYLGIGKAGNRQFADAQKAEEFLKQRYKVDEIYDKKLRSPTKIEKLMKPKPRVWAKLISEVGISQPPGEPKVCREGVDKNPRYQLPSPDDFPDLSGEAVSNPLLD